MKIPYPGDLNSIETAVWAAEYVRERFRLATYAGPAKDYEVEQAIRAANAAVTDLHKAREHAAKRADKKSDEA